jgi:hypothetical protein
MKSMASFKAVALAAALSFASLTVPALADESAEVSTAGTHAGMAAASTDIKMVHMHLHHVVNCLVGSSGAGFDKSAGNPCDGKGNGAIPEAAADKAGGLQAALAKAQAGIAADDLTEARKDAADAQGMLK